MRGTLTRPVHSLAVECVGRLERTPFHCCRVRCVGDNQRRRSLGSGQSRRRTRSMDGGGGRDGTYRAVRTSTGHGRYRGWIRPDAGRTRGACCRDHPGRCGRDQFGRWPSGPIRSIEDAAARLRAARDAARKEGVPSRRPASPHSSIRLRSPRRQWLATKPSTVTGEVASD
jgi:hypothetical protein